MKGLQKYFSSPLFVFVSGPLNFFLLPFPRTLFNQIFSCFFLAPLSLLKTITKAKRYETSLPKKQTNKVLYSTFCQTHCLDLFSLQRFQNLCSYLYFIFSIYFTRMEEFFSAYSAFHLQTLESIWDIVSV